MNEIEIHQLAAAYALDAVDDDERAAFEAHYPTCDECRVEVREFREVLADVGHAQTVAPPADVKSNVMAEIARTRQLSPVLPTSVVDLAERRRRRTRVAATFLAAAAVVVVLTVSVGALVGPGADDDGFGGEVAGVLSQPDVTVAALEGVDGSTVSLTWSEQAGEVAVVADGLADPGEGMAYELWLIDDRGPQPMGLLDRAADRQVRRVLPLDGAPAAWAVTVEPATGSAAPTGEILYTAEVS